MTLLGGLAVFLFGMEQMAEALKKAAVMNRLGEPEEIAEAVDETIAQTGADSMRDMGKVMGATMGRLKKTGKLVDGTKVKNIVQEKLSQ